MNIIASNLVRFEQLLLERKLVNSSQLVEIKNSAEFSAKGLFESLLNLKNITLPDLYHTAAEVWSVPFIDIQSDDYLINSDLGVPDNVLAELSAITLIDSGNSYIIAFGIPEKLSEINRLGFFAHKDFKPVLADIYQIRKALNQHKNQTSYPSDQTRDDSELFKHLSKAASVKASDLHIEPFKGYCRLRIRVDGILHPLQSLSSAHGRALIAQIKLHSGMDIAQSRLPQDGRFSHQLDQQTISLRVNAVPTINGEKLVLRLLEQHRQRFKLDKLGLFPKQYQLLRETLKQPSGLILVTGPTGAGKTVTLYALLELLNTGRENISTIEDPVEIHEDGINQISINRKVGLEFSQALRALLRQDPDILMVGEIRDSETAEIAVKAAQTGHLVMATLHTRSAANAKSRLLQLGVKKHSLHEALRLVIAQRLPRKLCSQCATELSTPESLKRRFRYADLPFSAFTFSAVGCALCLQGYSGRMGIFELLDYSAHAFNDNGKTQSEIHLSLEQAGLKRVLKGETSYEELIRVL